MARSNARTLGLLNRFPDVMHEDAWRFNQILGAGVRSVPNCSNQPYLQYERDYIARALATAVRQAQDYLGYAPAPTWQVEEIVTVDSDLAWNGQTLDTHYGRLLAFGKRASALIDDDVNVSYTDANDDGVDDTATLTVTTTHPADEIKVFFRVTDGASSAGHEYWEIEPLTVSKVGNTATITGPRWLFVHPKNVWTKEYTGDAQAEKFAGSTGETDHFVTTVDVYRVYNDPTNAVQLLLNPAVVGEDNAVINATAVITNAQHGQFRLYTADGQDAPGMQPHSVRVSYLAGEPLVDGRMETELETHIVRYANILCAQQPPCCDRGQSMWTEDRDFPPQQSAQDSWYAPPFGIRNGGLRLWSVIQPRRLELKAKAVSRRT